jgi:uncharacterized protein
MREVRKFARQLAERFRPEKIVLFGSHAGGTPHEDSDVDVLVVMPCRSRAGQAVAIRWELPVPFPMDLIVRTPRQMADRLAMGDSFLKQIVANGKVLYEASDRPVGPEGGKRPHARPRSPSIRVLMRANGKPERPVAGRDACDRNVELAWG